MCGLFLTVKCSCLFTAVAVLVCLRSLIGHVLRGQYILVFSCCFFAVADEMSKPVSEYTLDFPALLLAATVTLLQRHSFVTT